MAESLHVDDGLWAVLEPLLPERVPRRIGRPRVDYRIAFTAILFVLVTGVPWRVLPRQLGCSGVTACRWPLTGGHRNDVTQLLPRVDGIGAIAGKNGRPRRRPDRVIADRGYDHDKYRRELWRRGVKPVIAQPQYLRRVCGVRQPVEREDLPRVMPQPARQPGQPGGARRESRLVARRLRGGDRWG
jgi:transposase